MLLLKSFIGYVEFKLWRYFAAGLTREWRTINDLALMNYTRSLGHASTCRMWMHVRSITKMITAYHAGDLIRSWNQAMLRAACSTICTSYTPRMAYNRSTLQKIRDFHIHNLIQSWHQAMLDATYGDYEYEAWFSRWTRYSLAGYLKTHIRLSLRKILGFYILNCVTAWQRTVACHKAL